MKNSHVVSMVASPSQALKNLEKNIVQGRDGISTTCKTENLLLVQRLR